MAKLGPYQVLLRDLPTEKTLEVGPDRVAEWLKGLPMRDALGAPEVDPQAGQGTAQLELYTDEHGENSHVFANGSFHGWLTVACSRCVEPVKLEIAEQLRVTFMPKHEMPADDEDEAASGEDGAEVGSEDLDLFPYEGEVIDLEPLLREQFVLAVPYAPLCREDCKGLCAQCGTNKNTGACSCEAPIDPRLAALKGLKLPS